MKLGSALTFFLVIFLFTSLALAEAMKIEPGLWEHTMKMTSQSGKMEEAMRQARQQLDSLPPAQRQMMEQMMAAQGIGFGADENSFRICTSAEEIARNELHLADENCTQEILERSGNTIRVRFVCDVDPPSQGEGSVTIVNSREYTGNAVINTEMDGKPEVFHVTQRAHWLSADCGDIRPAHR